MAVPNELQSVLKQNGGIVTTAQANEVGVSNERLRLLVHSGDMVTVPTGYNPTRLREDGFTVFTIKRELHEIGVAKLTTMFGNSVTVYDMERTICDCLRSRNNLDIAVVTDALKRYAKRKDKNLNKLMQMAETFKVTKLLRGYMEVLL